MEAPKLGPGGLCEGRDFCGEPTCLSGERHIYVEIVDCRTGAHYDTKIKDRCACR